MNQYVRGTPYSLKAFSGMKPVVILPMQLATELSDTNTACSVSTASEHVPMIAAASA